MPTVIDSLLVTLGLDGSKFEAGRKKVDSGLDETGDKADKTGKKVKKSGDDSAKSMEGLAKKAAAFLAIIGGTMAIKRFVEDTIASSAAMDRLSRNLGTTTETVSAWSNAAELAGGSAQGLQGTMDMLSRSQTEMQITGQSGLIPYLSALGVAMGDTTGRARPVEDVLLDLATAFEKLPRTTANNLGRMMGLDEGTLNLLLKGRQEVELMIRRQKEFDIVTSQQAAQASKLQTSLRQGKQTLEAWGRAILIEAAPAIEKLLGMLSSFGDWVMENKEAVKTFLTILAVGLAAVAAAATPVNLVIVAVTALAAAIALLYQDYQTWKRGGESFIDWGKWEPGFKAAGAAIRWLRDLIGDLAYRAAAAADIVGAVFKRDWDRAKYAWGELKAGNGKTYGAEEPAAAEQVAPATKPPPVIAGRPIIETPSMAEGKKQTVEYFQAQGWTREQAAGIAANLQRESMFAPGAVGDKGSAYGIAQWHPDRQAEFAKVFGKPIQGSSLQDQLAFVQYELTKGQEQSAGARLKTAQTASEAAGVISKSYERPGDVEGEAQRRGKMADMILQTVPGASQYAAGAGAPAMMAAAAPAPQAPAAPSTSNETHIGEIKVYTAATDADGIAKDMGRSMNYLFTSQANYGLS